MSAPGWECPRFRAGNGPGALRCVGCGFPGSPDGPVHVPQVAPAAFVSVCTPAAGLGWDMQYWPGGWPVPGSILIAAGLVLGFAAGGVTLRRFGTWVLERLLDRKDP